MDRLRLACKVVNLVHTDNDKPALTGNPKLATAHPSKALTLNHRGHLLVLGFVMDTLFRIMKPQALPPNLTPPAYL